jgi:glycosyltransferase involved in cell wall biosynthesis
MVIEANIFRIMAATPSVPVKVAQILESAGGGVGRHAIDLVSTLGADPRFEVHLMHSAERMDERYRLGMGSFPNSVRVQEIDMTRPIQPGRDLRSLFAIYRYLRQHGPFNAVHVHSSKAGAIGALAARLAGVPEVVFTPHAFYSMGLGGKKKKLYQFIEKCCVTFCHHLVAVSAQEREYIVRNRLAPAKKIVVVPNAIPVNTPASTNHSPDLETNPRLRLRRELGIGPETRLIGSIGRLTPQKDPLAFVELVARRAARYDASAECYLMAGNGDLEPEVLRAIAQAGLEDRLHFLGFRSDVEDLMAALDIYVLHSRYEGMPYIVLEAMSHRLPIVSTRVAGVTEPLAEGGILVEVGDVAALDRAVEELVDPALRQRLGQANREQLEKYYSLPGMVSALSNLYQKI